MTFTISKTNLSLQLDVFWVKEPISGQQVHLWTSKTLETSQITTVSSCASRQSGPGAEIHGWGQHRASGVCRAGVGQGLSRARASAEGQFFSWGKSSLIEWDFCRSENLLKAAVSPAHTFCVPCGSLN